MTMESLSIGRLRLYDIVPTVKISRGFWLRRLLRAMLGLQPELRIQPSYPMAYVKISQEIIVKGIKLLVVSRCENSWFDQSGREWIGKPPAHDLLRGMITIIGPEQGYPQPKQWALYFRTDNDTPPWTSTL